MSFRSARRIRFSECDPAGIVFYPQYFVLFNDLLEEWVDSFWPRGFADFIVQSRFGMPTVRMEADFRAISRIGDDVILALGVNRVGRRSFELALECTGAADGQVRMSARQTIVTTSLDTHQATPIPAHLHEALTQLAATSRDAAGAPVLSQTSASR